MLQSAPIWRLREIKLKMNAVPMVGPLLGLLLVLLVFMGMLAFLFLPD